MEKRVIGVDLGGTKLLAGVIDEQGKVLESCREPVEVNAGPSGLVQQVIRVCRQLMTKTSSISAVGIASAGPLDPHQGCLLDPTNLHGPGETWGVVPLTKPISQEMGIPVGLENDAAAAVLAEHWLGGARGCDNAVMMTLGTGLGVGVIANGELLRSGRGLHPEVGHVFLHQGDQTAPCGCGNYGCAEAYLSGRNFSRRCAQLWGESGLTGEELVRRAQFGDEKALKAFDEYADYFAAMVSSLVVLFSPERILISGGFSESHSLFLDRARTQLEKLLSRRRQGVDLFPEISLSQLGAETGLLGGAYVGLNQLNS